jgi:hypothetical protein
MVADRSVSWAASAVVVMFQFEIRSLRLPSRLESAAVTFCWPEISFEMSCSSVPSVAWLRIADWRRASAEYWSESLSASPPVSPLTSGSWSSSSPGCGFPLSASP